MSEWDFIGLIDGVHQLGTPKSTDGKDGNPDKGRRTPASGGSPVAGCACRVATEFRWTGRPPDAVRLSR
jgi:hypothetical protein